MLLDLCDERVNDAGHVDECITYAFEAVESVHQQRKVHVRRAQIAMRAETGISTRVTILE